MQLKEYTHFIQHLSDQLYQIQPSALEQLALELYYFQSENNTIYRRYQKLLGLDYRHVTSMEQIPFMPIRFFKSFQIQTGTWSPQTYFQSSGTTSTNTSIHLIKDITTYRRHSLQNFQYFYPEEYEILALIPAYREHQHSSLVTMVHHLINTGPSSISNAFYLYNNEKLLEKLQQCQHQSKKMILFGLSFALLDFVEEFNPDLKHITIIETGGMKGQRKELICEDLHARLGKHFGKVHSEYGMCELYSQAYAQKNGQFRTPPWMNMYIREANDPKGAFIINRTGKINIIDLANMHTCAFIETEDQGKKYADGSVSVLGRIDHSDIRGCSLLYD